MLASRNNIAKGTVIGRSPVTGDILRQREAQRPSSVKRIDIRKVGQSGEVDSYAATLQCAYLHVSEI